MREVRYLDAARADFDAAVSWHETQRSRDAASRFLEQIGASIERIADLPLAWPPSKLDSRVHVRQLRRIRYAIFYLLSADAITVVAIAHTSRRPGYWLERIR
jgi:plasmid stabilization system protein ParE